MILSFLGGSCKAFVFLQAAVIRCYVPCVCLTSTGCNIALSLFACALVPRMLIKSLKLIIEKNRRLVNWSCHHIQRRFLKYSITTWLTNHVLQNSLPFLIPFVTNSPHLWDLDHARIHTENNSNIRLDQI